MRGILKLGRFLIWLAVFLFFYSSFLVLFQHGSANYVSKMIDGWGSIAQEFEKSYRTLTASAASSDRAAAPAQPSTASSDAAKKPGEMPGYVSMMIWGSVVVCLLGFFWMVAAAFQESMLWGLVILFVPLLTSAVAAVTQAGLVILLVLLLTPLIFIIFWITHFREATPPFVLLLIGGFVQFFIFSYYGIDFQEYFLGTPPELRPNQPNPLEGMIMPLLWFFLGS